MSSLDIDSNRKASKYTRGEQLRRVLWMAGAMLFRCIPRPFFGVRAALLRVFGARIGARVHIYPSTHVYMPWHLIVDDDAAIGEWVLIYNLGPVRIGARATVSHRAHLCAGTHDASDPALPLLKPPIEIGPDAWVCADAFVGPNVTIGQGAVVGAAAVCVRDVAPWSKVAGNPARVIGERTLREH